MTEIRKKVEEASAFYNQSFLSIDFRLADFGYQTLRPFLRGSLGLELGPASGYMTKRLIGDFETLHVVEGAADLLVQIPDYGNLIKHHCLFEEFETPLKFDSIIMSHVLEHISEPRAVLTKVCQWLKDGGVFLVAVPNANSLHRLVAVEMGLLSSQFALNDRDRQLGHYRVYDLENLKRELTECGFTIQEAGGYFLKPLSNRQIEDHWTQEMIDAFYEVGKRLPNYCAELFVVCERRVV